MRTKVRRFVAIYFLIVDIPLSIVGSIGLIGLLIGLAFAANPHSMDDGPDGVGQPLSLYHEVVGLIWFLVEFISILIGFALVLGYFESARKVLTWKAATINWFWWGSFLYNVLQAINLVGSMVVFGTADLRFLVIPVIPLIGGLLSYLCLDPLYMPKRSVTESEKERESLVV